MDLPTSWIVVRELGYSLKAIKEVQNIDEEIKAADLIEKLMNLYDEYYNSGLECSWIEDFSFSRKFSRTLNIEPSCHLLQVVLYIC